ncbi:sugar phosphate isomerase/epimerase family protein [Pseudomonas shahriarae]|uniref:sugar phosphate isomerase/epimerase family protein n=1 Tax=Pseudomonas shahriarae TaxID=2745512 RepID=UPI0023605C38|nr:sugar phosphate isomerase/epimerase [Pseudomonas shahriarae]MDD0982920.1 sugar phosphate isomerase/epimerase [Pseudomonas shahriarae]
MRLAISNIAWDTNEDDRVASLLQRFAVDAIDIAPGKYFPEPSNATDKDIVRVKDWWSDRGIEITGMQALLFGTTGLNVFGNPKSRADLLAHLAAICRIAGCLGGTRVVFGSPKNRDRSGLNDHEASDIAIPFFQQLGDIARTYGVTICLEPNPACYGANFMTTSADTARVVRDVAHTAICMQLDTGALTINRENPLDVVRDYGQLIGHVHISEPDLLPIGDGSTEHGSMASALSRGLPTHLVCIEMVATKNEPHLVSIERALQVATKHYRGVTA